MKRMVGILLTLSLLFTTGVALADYVNVALRSDLNVREGRSYESKIIGHLFRNDEVKVNERYDDGWAEISYNGKTAYVRNNRLSKTRLSGNGKSAFPTLRSGSSKPAVKTLQRNLNKIMGTKLTISGSFDKETKSVVIEFQEAYGLPSDGVVGPKTWAKIIELR